MDKKTAVDLGKTGAEITAGLAFGPVGTITTKALGAVVVPLLDHALQRRERLAKEFVEHFMDSAYPEETAVLLLEAEIQKAQAETKDAVVDALRALDDSLSDSVVPSLALLAREYLRTGRPKDRFFIGMLRLLRDLDGAEYEGLRKLVTTVVTTWPSPDTPDHDRRVVAKAVQPTSISLYLPPGAEAEWNHSYDSLFHRLAVVEFAAPPAGWASGKTGRRHVTAEWTLPREPWFGMHKIVGAPSGKAGAHFTP